MNPDILKKLEQRLGRLHAKQRLGIEKDHEAHVFTRGRSFFHIENWYSVHSLIRNSLKFAGLYWRGRRNAERLQLKHNRIKLAELPSAFESYVILHISDMHVDMGCPSICPELMVRMLLIGYCYSDPLGAALMSNRVHNSSRFEIEEPSRVQAPSRNRFKRAVPLFQEKKSLHA